VLTREVFGLEVVNSGFHKLLSRSVETERTYEAVLGRFGDQIGAEGKALVRSMIATRDDEGGD
jgi:hypothetical protein